MFEKTWEGKQNKHYLIYTEKNPEGEDIKLGKFLQD